MRLRSHLAVLVVAGVVPLLGLTVIVTASLVNQQRAAVDRGLSDTVAALATAIDTELGTAIKSLETLATSRRLDEGDLAAFHADAARVVRLHRWSTIGLIEADGKHVLNLARPFGDPLPDLRDREYFKRVMATGRPYVSDLLRGRTTATMDLGVAVPVVRDAGIRYVLFAGMDPAIFADVLQAQNLPSQAVASVVGRDGLFIARSPGHARFAGGQPNSHYLARIRDAAGGIYRGPDVEGIERHTAFARVPITGWTIAFGLPAEVQSAPVRRIAWAGGIGAAGIVLLALVLAAISARRMGRAIDTLSSATSALGHGEPLGPARPLRVAELDEMRRHLEAAERVLLARARERDDLLAAERRARVAAETAAHDLRESEAGRAELLARAEAARAEAEAASRAKDQFLAMLGHELRNPLGAIAVAVGVLERAGAPEVARPAREVIARQIQHLRRLVDDLLDVSRVTTGKITLHLEPHDLAALVASAMATQRAAGALDRHAVSVETAPAWVRGDDTRLEQLVSNLVGNALKYTPAGGRVDVRVRPEGESAVLEVADTGIGIPSHLIGRIFDAFVQDERPLDRAAGGLGLGLTLVRTLVAMHGGEVRAASPGPGKGAVFTVRLPRVEAAATAVAARVAELAGTASRRILVVDDNDDAREMLRVLLSMGGHEVIEARNGRDGIELAEAHGPDVALVDIGLPDLDGYEVARRIRAGQAGVSMRLVAVTGYGQPEDRQHAFAAGFDAHLTKPILPAALAELVDAPAGRDGSRPASGR